MRKRSTTARGYGSTHQATRKRLKPLVEAGLATCPRCLRPILPGQPWHLGHSDDRTTYTGPEHRRCNLQAAGTKGYAALEERRGSRPW